MNEPGLCENPACGGFFDQPSAPFWDEENKVVVLLCQECARSFEGEPGSRYQRIDPSSIPYPTKGADE